MEELFKLKAVDMTLFEDEKSKNRTLIEEILPDLAVIEVGSTAVPSLIGKNDVDFLVLTEEGTFSHVCSQLSKNFPVDNKQVSNSAYRAFVLPSTFDMKLQVTSSPEKYGMFIDFLNILKANQSTFKAYTNLKKRFHGKSMSAYRNEKREFIKSVLEMNKRNKP